MDSGERFPCPCCGHLVFHEPDSYGVCPVCAWIDNLLQVRWPDSTGVNDLSLIEAQANYARSVDSLVTPRLIGSVRPPRDDEPMDPEWRPFDPDRDENGPVCGIDYVDLHHQGRYPDDWDAYYYWRRDEDKVWGLRALQRKIADRCAAGMRVSYDPEADAAYISFTLETLSRGRDSVLCDPPSGEPDWIVLDWKDGKIVGLEVLDASSLLHPDLLEGAERSVATGTAAVLERVEKLIGTMRTPISDTMRRDGWNDDSVVAARQALESFADRLRGDEGHLPPKSERLNGLTWALDHLGVHAVHPGSFRRRIAALENDLREMT